MITQCELKELLDYNPDTGVFTWKKTVSNRTVVGSVAGNQDYNLYRRLTINGQRYMEHRLAYLYMTGNFPKNEMDHINHIPDDNRWANLRDATASQNCGNMRKYKTNTSGYKGVYKQKRTDKWYSQIKHNKKMIYIGTYSTPQEASEAYKKKAIELNGEFAYTGDNTIKVIYE